MQTVDLATAQQYKTENASFSPIEDTGALRFELKFLLKSLRNRCARWFTPERLQLQPLAGWQVNKKNSPVCYTSNLRRKQTNVYKLHSLF